MKGVLCRIMSQNQRAFIPGRSITDNILLTHKLLKGYGCKHGKQRYAFKIDIMKAYDIVYWDFLKEILKWFGFPLKFVNWVMICVRTAGFSICVNGDSFGYFKGGRGLRQGDHISPYLFTIVMEVLNLIIQRQIVIKLDLEEFSSTFGLVQNLGKSTMFYSNINEDLKNKILEIVPFAVGEKEDMGLPSIRIFQRSSERALLRNQGSYDQRRCSANQRTVGIENRINLAYLGPVPDMKLQKVIHGKALHKEMKEETRVATWVSELTFLAGSELDLASYKLFEDQFLATAEQELCPFGFLLASCHVSSSELHAASYSNSDDIQAASSDTRPPMLDRTDYDSWSQRIRLYCRGKENGIYILQSIDHGPFELGTTRDTLGTTPEGGVLLGPERPRTYDDLNDNDKKRFNADVRETNIVLQGLPKDIYKLINHNIEAKSIWDNVKMLLVGSELTKEDRESQLYNEFERFKMLPGENINEYYVRFHKLVNDMRNIRMTMPNIQLNSKFVNNMPPEWDRFVTAVKLNKGLKETNHEQLYGYLKQHEKHAAQDRLIIEKITLTTNDQLAFVSSIQPYVQLPHVQSHQSPSSSTPLQSPHVQSIQVVVQNVQVQQNQNQRNFARGAGAAGNGRAQNRARNANAGQGKPIKCYNCNGLGHIIRNCTQPKRPQNSDYFKDKMLLMQAQENDVVLDEEELLFLAGEQTNTFDADVDNQPVRDLALNEDNIFQADECDAFDSDVDDEPTTQSIFMASLSSTGPVNLQASPSNASILSEVHDLDNAIDLSNNDQVEHAIHNKVQQKNVIDSTSADMGNSNVIPYEQYLTVNDVSVVPSSASSVPNNAYVLHDNDAYVPHDPLATELNIYKEQVVMYKQRAKFELTLHEQKMDEQISILIRDHNKKEESLKKELYL
ncbi:integrase, catalytic region, zinc finger, CCHC-type containing protein [Tanacetum coccineum]|uniref:Integrase, catalytic region, zinc finger, CCHC-type containing protein n=1 Tax=Tanacetum coccineum TaxID=301880 RepID=A0ABQ5FM41_9ASTR